MPRRRITDRLLYHKGSKQYYQMYDGRPKYFGTDKQAAETAWHLHEAARLQKHRAILELHQLADKGGGYSGCMAPVTLEPMLLDHAAVLVKNAHSTPPQMNVQSDVVHVTSLLFGLKDDLRKPSVSDL